VVQIVLWYLDSGCSKHMTGDRSQLTNFVDKFLGTMDLGILFSVGQLCDSDLKVAFHQHTCFIHNQEGVDLLRIIKNIHVDFDELTAMASKQSSLGPELHEMTLVTISSGLVLNPTSSTPFVPPSRTNWDLLFQLLFNELLTPPPSVDHPALEVIAPITEVVAPEPAASTGSPSLTKVNQYAPSPSKTQTTPETHLPVIPNDVEEDNHDIEIAHMRNDPFFGMLIPEVSSDQSLSLDSIHTIVHLDYQISEHNSKWTKDHPLENIIGQLA
nr:integrase, catalytic region, zinc finger, CCHC-type, peptidase aspartic, catalytic [Tanacetum cinerariifolium]